MNALALARPNAAQFTPEELALQAVVPALVVGLLAFGLAWRAWNGTVRGLAAGTAWGAPVALGVGFFAAFVGIQGWPPARFYPELKTRLAWMALALAIIGLAQARSQRAWRVPALLVFGAAGAWILAHWHRNGSWSLGTTLLWWSGFVGATALAYELLEGLARRRAGALLPLALLLAVSLSAQAFYFAHSESHARLASGIAVPLGLAFLVGLRQRGFALARGGVVVFVPLFYGLALANHLTADLPASALALVLCAPLGAWLGELPCCAQRSLALRWGVSLFAVTLLAAAAIYLAHAANPAYDASDYLKSLGGG